MKDLNITLSGKQCSYDELDDSRRELVDAARNATHGSYAPYSHFRVGAALRMADGSIIKGANQENAAFSSGTCAERSAIFWAGANKPGMAVKAIAIAARREDDPEFQKNPISPCGACRQALMEYETLHGPIEVILYGGEKVYIIPSVATLLPFTFTEF